MGLKKKDRNQRRPGSRRSQEDGGGACELPLRAGPAALHNSAAQLQQQQPCKAAERRQQQQHLWARLLSVSRPRASPCNGPLTPKSTITLTITSLTLSLVGRDRRKKTWLQKKEEKEKVRASSIPGPLSFT